MTIRMCQIAPGDKLCSSRGRFNLLFDFPSHTSQFLQVSTNWQTKQVTSRYQMFFLGVVELHRAKMNVCVY